VKTREELQEIREAAKKQLDPHPKAGAKIRVVVGMATCGIAAGARPVLDTLMREVARHHLDDVVVTQTGCVGVCRLEPIVEVYAPGQEKVTYVKMTAKRAARVVAEHLINKNVVARYTIGAAD